MTVQRVLSMLLQPCTCTPQVDQHGYRIPPFTQPFLTSPRAAAATVPAGQAATTRQATSRQLPAAPGPRPNACTHGYQHDTNAAAPPHASTVRSRAGAPLPAFVATLLLQPRPLPAAPRRPGPSLLRQLPETPPPSRRRVAVLRHDAQQHVAGAVHAGQPPPVRQGGAARLQAAPRLGPVAHAVGLWGGVWGCGGVGVRQGGCEQEGGRAGKARAVRDSGRAVQVWWDGCDAVGGTQVPAAGWHGFEGQGTPMHHHHHHAAPTWKPRLKSSLKSASMPQQDVSSGHSAQGLAQHWERHSSSSTQLSSPGGGGLGWKACA